MAEITKALCDAVLKEDYGPDGIGNTAYEDNPWFAMMPKHKTKGKHFDFPVKYGYASNASHTASTALNKVNTVQYVEFNVTTVADYDAKSVALQALAEATDEGAFVDVLRDTVDSLIKALSNRAGQHAFGHRGAALGQVASISTTTLVLTDIDDVSNFEVGMEIASSEANGLTGSLQAGSATITAIDRATGTLTTDANWTDAGQIPSLDADDFLFASGDFGIGRAGLADWCPITRTGLGTAFYGATRSVDETRLAGQIVAGTGIPISHAIRKGAAVSGREAARQDCALMSFETYNDLVTELDAKVQYVKGDSKGMDASIGFEGIKIAGPKGPIECYADRSCSTNQLYLVKRDAWKAIHSQATPIKIMDEDGGMLSREASSFGFDVRGSSLLNFACTKPNTNCVVTL